MSLLSSIEGIGKTLELITNGSVLLSVDNLKSWTYWREFFHHILKKILIIRNLIEMLQSNFKR